MPKKKDSKNIEENNKEDLNIAFNTDDFFEEEHYEKEGSQGDVSEKTDDALDAISLPDLNEIALPAPPQMKPKNHLPAAVEHFLEDSHTEEDESEDEKEKEEDDQGHYLSSDSLDDLFPAQESEDSAADEYQETWGNHDSLAELTGEYEDDDDDDDELGGFDIDEVIAAAIEANASDIDIIPNDEISFEVLGDMKRIPEFGVISPDLTTRLQQKIISHVLEADFVEELELDTAYVVKTGRAKGRRLRLSVGKTFGEVFMVFRVISDVIPTPEELNIPQNVQNWSLLPNGLVILAGPTGSGKSTTFASLIKKIQLEAPKKIITIEKPIEYTYGVEGEAVITQREVGKDARTFAAALKSAMRQHPKVIMVGEVRDQEEVDELLRAAETGHLALTTIHATSPPGVINRIMSLYEGETQRRVLSSLKDNLRGIANQTLVKTVDGTGRVALHSALDVTPEVADMIGRGDTQAMQDYMNQRGLTMEHALAKAAKDGICTLEEARSKATLPSLFDEIYNSQK